MLRNDERGIAIIMALFLTMLVSAVAAGMAFVARTETLSSQSYTTMSQARYAAESGLSAATNYLLSNKYQALGPGTASDPLPLTTNYVTTAYPVTRGGNPVLLSTVANASNYPVNTVATDFTAASSGTLAIGNGNAQYGARARLLTMRQIADVMAGGTRIVQTWEVTGVGRLTGSGSANVEVTAIIERQTVPAFRYAAFATSLGCGSLNFSGGATTNSYNSASLVSGSPLIVNGNGDVGTNGNLSISGSNTTINGILSTPRTGVGTCTASNVTAETIEGKATVSGGLVELPQSVEYPTPPAVTAPTTAQNFTKNSGCLGVPFCTSSSNILTFPAGNYSLGNVVVNGQGQLVLHAGTYIVNSLTIAGGSTISIAGDGPVIIKVAGGSLTGDAVNIAGNTLTNSTYDPSQLQIIYSGTNNVSVAGGTGSSAIVYAPKAPVTITGNSDYYGAVVAGQVTVPGSARLHYDTNLTNSATTAGNPVMSTFTWRTF